MKNPRATPPLLPSFYEMRKLPDFRIDFDAAAALIGLP